MLLEETTGLPGAFCVSVFAVESRLRLRACARVGGTGRRCRKTFARKFWSPTAEARWRTIIAICLWPLESGGIADFGAFLSMMGKRPNWSLALPRPLVIPDVMTLKTLGDVRLAVCPWIGLIPAGSTAGDAVSPPAPVPTASAIAEDLNDPGGLMP